jgi:uncharacterized protein DUF6226
MAEHHERFEEPPPEAYSRVTNAERFRDLHRIALDRLAELESTFDVERRDIEAPDPEIRVQLARPSILLAPRDPGAAPLVVSFTTFPGLYVRAGRWILSAFPSCGCDACDEALEDQSRRFLELIDNVVAGRFRESINIPLVGNARLQWGFSLPHSDAWQRIDRKKARELVGGGQASSTWRAWRNR